MKRIRLRISYDGTAYHGWQVQPNGITVQEKIQDCLEQLLGFRPNVTGCSRTDAGVHAREFYCHLDCAEDIPNSAFLKGLNSILPDDIAVNDCIHVDDSFHARYDAKAKQYIYRMYCGIKDPFISRYALRLDKSPNITLADNFCKDIIGKHDFYGFSSSGRTVTNTVRTVSECSFYENNGIYMLKISADGFLYNMVRIIAGTVLEVSYGKRNPNCAAQIFKTKERSFAGKTLPPQGLFLEKVFY